MECPNCSFVNSADSRFCENCGQPLETACPNCGQAVPSAAKFCRHCGYDLSQTAPAAPSTVPRSAGLEAIRRAAPSAMAKKILADRERTEGERKRVTALFADIVGSTTLAEALDPEDWREIVSGAHQRISEKVYAYEGTIAQLLGDGVLASSGAADAWDDRSALSAPPWRCANRYAATGTSWWPQAESRVSRYASASTRGWSSSETSAMTCIWNTWR
jgi:hypothetical protein